MKTLINLNKEKRQRLTFNKTGDYLVFFQNLSGEFSFEINQKDVNLNIYGIYNGKNNDNFLLKTKQLHQAAGSTSNLLIKGVFKDRSKFVYQGLIRIEKNAQRSHAYQKNQNLVLSKDVYVDSRPFLEILANDVYCTHGSTTGGLNKDDVFYLMTRGLSKGGSENLLVKGFLGEIYNKIKDKIAKE